MFLRSYFKRSFALLIVLTVFFSTGCDKNKHSPEKIMKKITGQSFVGYSWLEVPTTAFGAGSMWTGSDRTKVSEENFLGDVFSTFEIDPDSNPLFLGGLATVGSGWTVTMNSSQTTEAGGSLGVPLLEQILGVNLDNQIQKNHNVEVKIGRVYKRVLNGELFAQKLGTLNSDSMILDQLRNGSLVVTMSDIVLEDVQIVVSESDKLGSQAELKLNNLAEEVGVDTGGAVGIDFSVAKGGNSQYLLSSKKPIVVAVKNKRMTKPPGLEAYLEKKKFRKQS